MDPDIKVSAVDEKGIDELKELIFRKMDFIRIYMKEPGEDADMEEPLITRKGSTVRDVCNKLHRDFVKNFKYCRVTGPSAKFPDQKLSLNHTLKDEDILELHIR